MSISIFVLLLEKNRYFIYRSYNKMNIDFQLFIEFEICYDFPKLYKPLNIVEIIPEENSFHLDYIVKKYMIKYGIENVRGGSYSQTILSEKQTEMLQFELSSVSKYENYKEKLNSFIVINENSKEEFNWLRDICNTIYSEYEYKYENKKKYIEFYKNTILWQKQNNSILQRYSKLLETCKYIHRIYNKEFHEDTVDHVYFKHPEFLLDTFFLHKYQIDSVKMCEVGTFCDMMLFMTEKIIDRISNLHIF